MILQYPVPLYNNYTQLGIIIMQSNITWYYITVRTEVQYKSEFGPAKDTPYLTLMGKLWVYFVKIWEKIDNVITTLHWMYFSHNESSDELHSQAKLSMPDLCSIIWKMGLPWALLSAEIVSLTQISIESLVLTKQYTHDINPLDFNDIVWYIDVVFLQFMYIFIIPCNNFIFHVEVRAYLISSHFISSNVTDGITLKHHKVYCF